MAEILNFRTPSRGSSSIYVERNERGGIALKFRREMGDGQVVTESIVGMSLPQAEKVAKAMLAEVEKG